jgi:hypothetical protein
VVLFFHGWTSSSDPTPYDAFCRHLAKKGFIVIFPKYMINTVSDPIWARDNARGAVWLALSELLMHPDNHVAPELENIGVTGHSFGGALAADYAANHASYGPFGLPEPKAVVSLFPGSLPFCEADEPQDYLWGGAGRLSNIDPDTLLVLMVGENDTTVCDNGARLIYCQTERVPPNNPPGSGNKEYLIVQTDTHGSPSLIADHVAPATYDHLDALDFFGFWKITTAAMNCAFYNQDCAYAHPAGSYQRVNYQLPMGQWSDGVKVKPMLSVPPTCP